jgi:tetratricopeptide (TPR) repeat protein
MLALAALAALVWEPANPARLEPLFRQHWEATETAAAARDYGVFLSRVGDREGAARMLRRALEGGESVDILEALASIVSPAEALGYYERALALRPAGDLYRRTGALFESRGDMASAAKRYRAALALYEKELGAAHPKVAVALNDLGLLAERRADFAAAESFYRRALAIQEKAFGPVHPEVGTTLNNLGGAVGAGGKLTAAEPLLLRALSVLEQTLGPRHSRVAACVVNVGDLLAALERPAAARALYSRAQSIYETLGDTESARRVREVASRLP